MNDIILNVLEIDESKMYLITPKERLRPEEMMRVRDILERGGIRCVFLLTPVDVVPVDQIDRVEIQK